MRTSILVLAALLLGNVTSSAEYYVSPAGNDAWSGRLPEPNRTRTDGPFATLERARDANRVRFGPKRIIVRGGTYHLAEPLVITPADSGLAITAFPNERPVLSGGIPIGNWQKTERDIWATRVPQPRQGRFDIRVLRVGDQWQTMARYPNIDPRQPLTSGWLFVPPGTEPRRGGEFGEGVANIHNEGDWLEWRVDVPADGIYRLWFLYAADNRPSGFTDMGPRSSIRLNQQQPVSLMNLRDTGSWDDFRWANCAALYMTRGTHTLRWTNIQGGGMNLDALALCDDARWAPRGQAQNRPFPGRNLVIVQAEALAASRGKEIQVDAETAAGGGEADRFRYRPGDVRHWPRSPDAEVHIFPAKGWVNAILKIDRNERDANTLLLEKTPSASQRIRPGNRYFIANVFEELDQPGEWFYDRRAGVLYYWPLSPQFQRMPAVVSVLDRLIEIAGDPARNRFVERVTIQGLDFRDTTYSRDIDVYQPQDAAIHLSGARRCLIEGNRFIGVGGYGVLLKERSEANEIVGNEIAHNGQGGVILVGNTATQPRENLVAGNWIHHGGRIYKHVAGVYCTTASGTRVAHNRIEQMPRYGISFKSYGPDYSSHNNIAEYNDILFTVLETIDAGAIETLGKDKADSGNVIQYNCILDVPGLANSPEGKLVSPFMTWGIYLDDHSSGTTVRGNIAARYSWGGVCIHGGRNNVIDNNIFMDGDVHQMRIQIPDDFCKNNRLVRNIFSHRTDGELIKHTGRWRPDILAESNFNVFWNTQARTYFVPGRRITPLGAFTDWQQGGFDTRSAVSDPQFVDAARNDYRLRPESPALRLGFKPIPVEKIGLEGYDRAWKR